MQGRWGRRIKALTEGATSTPYLVELSDGRLAVEKVARHSHREAASCVKAEGWLLSKYRGVPGFLQLIAADLEGNPPALLLEHADGGTLKSWLQATNQAAVDDVLQVLKTVGGALQLMHANGDVHRDLKPDNIFIVGDQVRVGDLGHAHGGPPKTIGSFGFTGTQGYVAPEVLTDNKVYPESDIYSLGVVAREMLLGRHPGTTRDVRTERRDVPADLAALLWWMGAKKRDRPSAREVVEVLDGVRRVHRIPSRAAPSKPSGPGMGGLVAAAVTGVAVVGLLSMFFDD